MLVERMGKLNMESITQTRYDPSRRVLELLTDL